MSRSGIINIFDIIGLLYNFAFGPLIGWIDWLEPSFIGSNWHVRERPQKEIQINLGIDTFVNYALHSILNRVIPESDLYFKEQSQIDV